jgi:hypothetical protein
LEELSEEHPHLNFLLHPDTFDYNRVDFSHYMWANFAQKPNLMKYFVMHKDVLLPSLQERVRKGYAKETEKKILYGFLVSDKEIWKI